MGGGVEKFNKFKNLRFHSKTKIFKFDLIFLIFSTPNLMAILNDFCHFSFYFSFFFFCILDRNSLSYSHNSSQI